ncbi:hypothetical protein [Herpetosiphon llansteffanensis]|uniref:hypothetical protein n=1 Tax=Herpetosiphon llansteffanensis TaxID=2094568 RepID=UPI000D7BC429|nr:hypothetical protein [Herpetosiphon llansteffanensis]
MQPQRERVKLGKDRNWWRLLPVLGALGLIGLMLVLTFMPNELDDANVEPSAVALLRSPTPSMQPSPTLIAAPFPARPADPPPIQLLPDNLGEIRVVTVQPELALTTVPPNLPDNSTRLPTIVPVIESATSMPVATFEAATVTPLPTLTARPTPATQSQRYAIVHSPAGHNLVQVAANELVSIAAVDAYAERFMALLPEQQRLLIPRNEQLVAVDLATGRELWHYGLLPKTALDYTSRLTLDQAGTGVYLIELNQATMIWRLSHLGLNDGILLQPVQNFKLPAVDQLLLTSTGQLWFSTPETLFYYDSATQAYQEFGSLSNAAILGDGRQPLLGVFRSPTMFNLINWATGEERPVELAAIPFDRMLRAGFLSNDQTILVVDSAASPTSSLSENNDDYLAYDLQTGRLIASIKHSMFSSLYPTTSADQWLVVTPDYVNSKRDFSLWNIATNTLTEVFEPAIVGDQNILWLGEVAGAPIKPLGNEFQAAVTPLPSPVSIFDKTPLPTILPATTKPVALIASGGAIQRINSDQQMELLADFGVRTFPRYNQLPLVLQRPQARLWQLLDLTTQQTVEWKFEKVLSAGDLDFNPLLAPDYRSLLVIVGQDLRRTDQFTGSSQLIQINLQTSEWDVITDSWTWPELQWAKPIAWHDDSAYFLQVEVNLKVLWHVQLGPPFQATKLAEIPFVVANDPAVSSVPIYASIVVSPNQRWLLYPLATANKETMLVKVLDLVEQQSHEFTLPLIDLVHLSFAPDGERFGLILPSLNNQNNSYVSLYEFAQQRWYQLDTGFYANGIDQFLWSPDGKWLAVNFGYIGLNRRLSIYNTQQPSLALRSEIEPIEHRLLALGNDGKTLLTGQTWKPAFTQLTWREHEWQTEWRMAPLEINLDSLHYVYPR